MATATPSASGFLNGATPSRFEDSRTAPSSAISQKPETRSLNGGSDAGLPNESTYSDATTFEKVKAAVPTNVEEAKVAASNAASAVGAAATGAAASLGLSSGSAAPTGDASALQRQLDEARAEIKRLKEIINSKEGEGLRQRNVGSSSQASTGSSPGAATATISQDGIPLPMVGALCAGVFVFTWYVPYCPSAVHCAGADNLHSLAGSSSKIISACLPGPLISLARVECKCAKFTQESG